MCIFCLGQVVVCVLINLKYFIQKEETRKRSYRLFKFRAIRPQILYWSVNVKVNQDQSKIVEKKSNYDISNQWVRQRGLKKITVSMIYISL